MEGIGDCVLLRTFEGGVLMIKAVHTQHSAQLRSMTGMTVMANDYCANEPELMILFRLAITKHCQRAKPNKSDDFSQDKLDISIHYLSFQIVSR